AERTNQDPHDLLAKAGVPSAVFAALARLGISLQQVDHVAAGAVIPDADMREFRLAVVLALRHSVADEDEFLAHLKAQRVVHGEQTHYKVDLAGFRWWLTRVSDTTWVFGWSERDLEPADSGGHTQLSAGLREMLDEKLPANATAWAVADRARW